MTSDPAPGITLHLGDCLDVMGEIPDGSIDLVLCDPPYGVTSCRWDTVIPFEPLWAHYRRLLKPRGAVVLTASQPFTSMLVMSNPEWFKYCLVWDKVLGGNPLNAPYQPMRTHEDICVFSPAASTYSRASGMTYRPQMSPGEPYDKSSNHRIAKRIFRSPIEAMPSANATGDRYPTSILRFSNAARNKEHPTQKPVNLFEYLIRTYSNELDLVLDNCFGSCTTGVACLNTNRRFVGIEKDPDYFEIGKRKAEERQYEIDCMLIKPWQSFPEPIRGVS